MTVHTAKRLLGSIIQTKIDGKITSGRIVETEAYLSANDPACHASKGRTKRNEHMFLPAGYSYVYLIYGMYYCFNVVTEKEGVGAAVLIRAVEPITGISTMIDRRGTEKNLTNGPGRLCEALGISKDHSGLRLDRGIIQIKTGERVRNIVSTPRIGITHGKELLLRFHEKNNPYVSPVSSSSQRSRNS